MKILNLTQGSPAWVAARINYLCASEAPIMMGVSKTDKRNDLLYLKTAADEKEFSDFVQRRILDKGHEYEAAAREIAEEIIGQELYPATVSDDDGRLLASLDGMTMGEDILFEHKQPNKELLQAVQDGECPESHRWQVVQALHITGAEKCIFAVSDGTRENFHYCWVKLEDGDTKRLLAGWAQFEDDLANYKHVEVLPAPTAEPVMSLPSVTVTVQGSLAVTSNLALFGEKLQDFVDRIDKNPSDDQAFANCEAAIKTLKKAEDALDAAESGALAQVACIDEMRSLKQTLHTFARTTRLAQEKLVKTRKETIRVEIRQAADRAFQDHCATINKRLEKVHLPVIATDFTGVMKGKKTVSSLRDAVDTELARVKIEANDVAERIEANLRSLRELAADHAFLFMDTQQIVLKDNADLVNLIKLRIAEHKEQEDKRLEAERAKIRAEEEAKAAQEAPQRPPEPAPAPVAAASTAPLPAKGAGKPAARTRPSDEEIIEVLVLHYRVHESKVIEWLLDLDLEAESNKLRRAM